MERRGRATHGGLVAGAGCATQHEADRAPPFVLRAGGGGEGEVSLDYIIPPYTLHTWGGGRSLVRGAEPESGEGACIYYLPKP